MSAVGALTTEAGGLHATPAARLSRIGHGLIAVVIVVALVIQLTLLAQGGVDSNSGSDTSQVGLAVRLLRFFSYFTIESNVLVLVAAVTLALRPDRDGRLWRVLRLDALLGITITGIVFEVVLAGQVHPTGAAMVANIGFHYVAPWATVILWLIVGPRPRIDTATIAWAFVWPVAWIAWTFLHGAISGFWPYPFLDADLHGYPVALRNTGFVVVIALVLALLLRGADRRLPRR
jgi:hypothetical protein